MNPTSPAPASNMDAKPMGPVLQKLVNVMGHDRGVSLYCDVLASLGIEELSTAEDRVRFGDALIVQGGMLGSIGRAIKVQAILQGADVYRSLPTR